MTALATDTPAASPAAAGDGARHIHPVLRGGVLLRSVALLLGLAMFALGIALSDDGDDLAIGPIALELPSHPAAELATGPRTGVSGEGGTDRYPWRFWIPGDPTVSPYKRHAPKRRRPSEG